MATTTPGAVTLSVEFAGVCLYVIDDRTQKRTVSVLTPTCLPNDQVRTTHEDEDRGERHVPYLLMNQANFDPDPKKRVPPGFVADGPLFQVVRRLSREEILIKLNESQEPVALEPNPLPLPNLSVYNNEIRLKEGLLSDFKRLEPDALPELSVRTILQGGTLTATTLDGTLGQKNRNWGDNPAGWAGSIEWTGTVPEPVTIGIRSWATGREQQPPLTLWPVTIDGQKVIKLKIANLCETNPLEWWQFEHRLQRDDVDFKWLFRLFDPIDRKAHPRLLDVFGGRGHKFPYPKLNDRPARTTGSQGCTGGQFGLP